MRSETVFRRGDLAALLYVGAVGLAGMALLGLSLRLVVASGRPGGEILLWAGIAILTLLAGRLSIRLPLPRCIVSFSDALIFLTALLFGPGLATITGALDGYASSARNGGTWRKRIFNSGGMALSVGLAARLFRRVVPEAGVWGSSARVLAGIVLLAATQYVVNTALVIGAVTLNDRIAAAHVLHHSFAWAGVCNVAGTVAAACVFLAVRKLGATSCIAILPVPVVLHLLYRAAIERWQATKAPSRG